MSTDGAWRFVIGFGLARRAVFGVVLGVDFSGQFFTLM
jgi:hypothetical protein